MIRQPPRSTLDRSSAASDVYKRQTKVGQEKLIENALTFINSYVDNCNKMKESIEVVEWANSNKLTTQSFKAELKLSLIHISEPTRPY